MGRKARDLLRRFERKVRVTHYGETVYAEATLNGNILDHTSTQERNACPIALEQWLSEPKAWQVIASYRSYEFALPAAKTLIDQARSGQARPAMTYRLRDRQKGDIIPCDIL